jgi:hypothetical protein
LLVISAYLVQSSMPIPRQKHDRAAVAASG